MWTWQYVETIKCVKLKIISEFRLKIDSGFIQKIIILFHLFPSTNYHKKISIFLDIQKNTSIYIVATFNNRKNYLL